MVSPLLVAMGAAALAALAEWLHARRSARLAGLAFAGGRARAWARWTPPLRVAALALLAWGLTVLAAPAVQPRVAASAGQRLLIALDVSPSMHLRDAGPAGQQTRAERARDVLRRLLARAGDRPLRVGIIAFHSSALPVLAGSSDRDVVANVLDDLPLEHAFVSGKTRLHEAIACADRLARPWPPGSTGLVLVSDGDSEPAEAPPVLPGAIGSAVILGVGDAQRGTFIDDHVSRQEPGALRRLAEQLRGGYHDINRREPPAAVLDRLLPAPPAAGPDRRALALAAAAVGAAITALLPLALRLHGAPAVAHA
jgi:Ca-activated chloride channel family protein